MNFMELEALPVAELKAKRAEYLGRLEAEPALLKEQYYRRMLDAKIRDEKLGEQGKTIALLQENAEGAKARIAQLEARLAETVQRLQCAQTDFSRTLAETRQAHDYQQQRADAAEAKAARFEALAKNAAIAIGDALSAVTQANSTLVRAGTLIAVDTAEHGE